MFQLGTNDGLRRRWPPTANLEHVPKERTGTWIAWFAGGITIELGTIGQRELGQLISICEEEVAPKEGGLPSFAL